MSEAKNVPKIDYVILYERPQINFPIIKQKYFSNTFKLQLLIIVLITLNFAEWLQYFGITGMLTAHFDITCY